MKKALALLLMLHGATAVHAGGFFFDRGASKVLSEEERMAIVQEGYSCNRPNKTPEEERRCKEALARARQLIADRIRANQEAIEPLVRDIHDLAR
ncbi:hypothetical protein Hthe01_18720 [Hydrogenophilus thermoluteolus]|uniref:hypothetical protein n=1 Tax=Hydrogenophilus thermoluteolus TaxID=297 RepID=UPI0024A0C97A|nr:hypothetical protein [Hydrogenophilus thermoluteolus]GLW61523.1 hypothetical protein Hthe01_18720 [Hydrogenophilus thermoluteolus]